MKITIAVFAILCGTMFTSASVTNACGGETACQVDTGLYHARIPDGAGPHPAIVFLHGWGGSGKGQMKNRRLVNAFIDSGYAVIAPTGQPRSRGRSGFRWNSTAVKSMRDDVVFLHSVADDAAARFNLDRRRMVLGGFSGGGMMTWWAACNAHKGFSAYLPVAGLFWRPLPASCNGPVRMLHAHGWSDPVVPIEGRAVAGGKFQQGDLFRGLELIRRSNGCRRDDPSSYDVKGSFWLRSWTHCSPGTALVFALHSGGHAIPRGWATMVLEWLRTHNKTN